MYTICSLLSKLSDLFTKVQRRLVPRRDLTSYRLKWYVPPLLAPPRFQCPAVSVLYFRFLGYCSLHNCLVVMFLS